MQRKENFPPGKIRRRRLRKKLTGDTSRKCGNGAPKKQLSPPKKVTFTWSPNLKSFLCNCCGCPVPHGNTKEHTRNCSPAVWRPPVRECIKKNLII